MPHAVSPIRPRAGRAAALRGGRRTVAAAASAAAAEAAALAAAADAGAVRTRRSQRLWMVLLALGIAAIVAGAALILGPLYGVWHRGANDNKALQSWQRGPSTITGPVSGAPDAGKTTCGSSSASD